jgi:hypothetical protein
LAPIDQATIRPRTSPVVAAAIGACAIVGTRKADSRSVIRHSMLATADDASGSSALRADRFMVPADEVIE